MNVKNAAKNRNIYMNKYKPYNDWVLVELVLPESSLVLSEVASESSLGQVIVRDVSPDLDIKLEVGSEILYHPRSQPVGTLDKHLFFIRSKDVICSLERISDEKTVDLTIPPGL